MPCASAFFTRRIRRCGQHPSSFRSRAEENHLKHANQVLVLAALAAGAAHAGATTIDFDNLTVGTTLSSQYAGVVFSPMH